MGRRAYELFSDAGREPFLHPVGKGLFVDSENFSQERHETDVGGVVHEGSAATSLPSSPTSAQTVHVPAQLSTTQTGSKHHELWMMQQTWFVLARPVAATPPPWPRGPLAKPVAGKSPWGAKTPDMSQFPGPTLEGGGGGVR